MPHIQFFSEEIAFELPNPAEIATWIEGVIRQEKFVLVQLNFIFCSDSCLHARNMRYLRHDTLTDVLTFDYADIPETIEGEVYISVDRVAANARTWGQPFIGELHVVMVHGVLHLLGYKDQTSDEKALMRQKEREYVMQKHGIAVSRNTQNKYDTEATDRKT